MSRDPERRAPAIDPALIVLLTMGGFGVMGGALVAPGLPSLVEPFDVSSDAVGLVLGSYTLSAALSLPLIGLLLDRLGRRTVGLACLVLDGTAGVLCAFAPGFTALLVLRFLQGAGIAGLIPVSMTIIRDWYTDRGDRLKILGLLSGTISASAMIIPLVGGLLAARDWRYPFLAYGFSLLLALLFYFLVGETVSLEDLPQPGLRRVVSSHIESLAGAFTIVRVRETFMHAVVLYFLLYSLVTYLPLFLIRVHALNELFAGAALSVQSLVAAIVSTQAGFIDTFMPTKRKLLIGFCAITLSLALLPFWPVAHLVVASLGLFGLGMGIVHPVIYHEATAAPPEHMAGSVVSLFNAMKYVGMTSAPLILGMLGWTTGSLFLFASLVALCWALLFLVTSTPGVRS